MNGVLLTNRSSVDRNKTDYYRTPPDVTTALLRFLEDIGAISPTDVIWEPACGTGEMVEAMRGKGYSVTATDLYPSGYTEGGDDFLTTGRPCDWIITNPPFSIAEKFIRRATMEIGKPCAFLLKSQYWHAKSRLKLFRDHPPAYVLPLTWRPDFLWGEKSGSPTMECIWTVWQGDNKHAPVYVPLERP